MAQTIVTLCDPCLMEGKEAPAQTWGLAVAAPGSKAAPYEIDVCELHADPYRVLLAHLAEDGRRADRKRPLPSVAAPGATVAPRAGSDGGPHVCPVCGHETPSAGGMPSHVKNAHNMTLAEATGQASISCPMPGCDRHFKARQGQSAHLRSAHGLNRDQARKVLDDAEAA